MRLSHIVVRSITLILIAAMAFPATAYAVADGPDSGHSADSNSGRLLIGVQAGLTRDEVATQLSVTGLKMSRYWPNLGIAEIEPATSAATAHTQASVMAADVLHALDQNDYAQQTFRYISPDQLVFAATEQISTAVPPDLEPEPNDPFYDEQWAPKRIDAVQSWNISHGSPNVVVGVIDSGYNADHPDIDDAIIWHNQAEVDGVSGVDDDGNGYVDDFTGWDWVGVDGFTQDNEPDDPFGHGTHVLGVVAALTDNAVGIAGLGRHIQVAPLRVLDSQGNGYVSDLIAALDYAVAMDINIVNLSLTIGSDNWAIRDAVSTAAGAGVLIVAAAGNYSTNVYWPAAYPETFAVASTDSQDRRSSFSNFGPEVDVAAPGSGILSLYTGSSYSTQSGTSMATPHASALFGLLTSLRPDLDNAALIDIVKATAEDVNAATHPGEDDYLGAGRINFYQALLLASAGVSLSATPATLDPLPLGVPLALSVKASVTASDTTTATADDGTDSTLPIQGAMVYVQVLGTGGTPGNLVTAPIQRNTTDATGNASFSVPTPSQAGYYTVRVQVGAAYQDLPLIIVEPPTEINLEVQDSEMLVGNESTEYYVRLRDDEGQLLTGTTPIHVATSAGVLVGGSMTLDTVAQDGLYTGTLRAGTVAGSGSLSVSIGTKSESIAIHILPDEPADVVLSLRSQDLDAVETEFTFDVYVYDQYANHVLDGILVQPSTSAGILVPSHTLSTQDGQAVFRVGVPHSYAGPVEVTAEVTGTTLTESAIVEVPHIWMPIVR